MTVFSSLLNRAYVAWQPQRTSDGQGGFVVSFASVGQVQGRMSQRSGSEVDVADSEERQVSHTFFVGADDSVGAQIGRDFLITPADDVNRTFIVQGVREPSLAGEHLEIDCYQRQLAANEVLIGS